MVVVADRDGLMVVADRDGLMRVAGLFEFIFLPNINFVCRE